MKYDEFDKMFNDMDKVFQEMDKVMKHMEKKMEESFDAQQEQITEQWKPWFAWHPVKVNGRTRWMKTVYRRSHWQYGKGLNRVWEYGTVFDAIKDAK